MSEAGGVSRWTRRFSLGSALSMVALQIAFLFGASLRVVAVVGLFGAVLPMVFGMGYLLFPSYVGRTLSTPRLPAVHFVAAYAGVGLLLWHELRGPKPAVLAGGVALWSAGVAVFVGALLRTVAPAIPATPGAILRRSRHATALALAVPLAVGYLVVGTFMLLPPTEKALAAVPTAVHLYATGFVAVLIFALGSRLLREFFGVAPPKPLPWLALLGGGLAPGIVAFALYRPPWFAVGAALELAAMAAYAALVAVVAHRTERRRVGLSGVGVGAVGGVVAVGIALGAALGIAGGPGIRTHVVVACDGFLLPTIIGYAYLFFPVTNGQFPGASRRSAAATVLLLAAGTGFYAVGSSVALRWFRPLGLALTLTGTAGYASLLGRRLL